VTLTVVNSRLDRLFPVKKSTFMILVSFAVILGIIALVGFLIIGLYNNLVALRNRVKNAFAQIDVQLKRRYDLIPNLVEAAKGYMSHEKETLSAVIEARNSALSARNTAAQNSTSGSAIGALNTAEVELTAAMGKFFALAESYPDLKANQNVATLMEELSSTENRVGFARQAFNDSVMTYNTAIQSFPANLIAGRFCFQEMTLLEAIKTEQEREAPKVSFT
jgi:LemA protein